MSLVFLVSVNPNMAGADAGDAGAREESAQSEEEPGELSSLRTENARLRDNITRLTDRLEASRSYAEDLARQVDKLSRRLAKSSIDTSTQECQTNEDDLRESRAKWEGRITPWGGADDGGATTEAADSESVAQQVARAAGEEVEAQFLRRMAYEESSGLYYDFDSGYYYDAERRLYYDGHSGTYYRYDYEAKKYEVHSTTNLGTNTKEDKKKKKKSRRRKSDKRSGSEEEGECKDEEDEEYEEEVIELSSSEDGDKVEEEKEADQYEDDEFTHPPPCIRLVVTASESDPDSVGSLHLVTPSGGTVGRCGDQHAVLLSGEPGCSKFHARFDFDKKKGSYSLTDLGSRNGTFLGPGMRRLSPALAESDAVDVGHGTSIQIGTTALLCHVHPGRETCLECEPGLTRREKKKTNDTEVVSAAEKERRRKAESAAIRSKYGIGGSAINLSTTVKEGRYSDRAYKRRREKGSDNPYEKTEAADAKVAMTAKNKGFRMLSKMGWKEGEGLGAEGRKGRAEPVAVEQRRERAGLGVERAEVSSSAAAAERKGEVWRKVQERYQGLPDAVHLAEDDGDEENK